MAKDPPLPLSRCGWVGEHSALICRAVMAVASRPACPASPLCPAERGSQRALTSGIVSMALSQGGPHWAP